MVAVKTTLLSPLGQSGFPRLTVANGLSLFGEYVQLVGLAGTALATLHTASAWAAVLLAQALPQAALLPLGGMAADRHGPRTVAAAAGAAQAMLATALAGLSRRHGPAAWELFVYAAALGTSLAFTLPAFSAMVAEVAPAHELRSANGLLQMVENLTRFLGPAAAALVVPFGSELPFGLAAFAWAASGVAVLGTAGPPGVRATATEAGIGAGARALRADPVLASLLPALGIFALGYAGATYVGLPALATLALHAGPGGTGTLFAASGIGALAGALAMAAAVRVPRPALVGSAAAAAAGVAMGWAALAPSLRAAVPALVLCGAAFSGCLVLAITLVQTRAPAAVRGRVLGLVIMGFFGVYPLAYAAATLTGDGLGPRGIVAAGAICMVTGGVLGLSQRALRSVAL